MSMIFFLLFLTGLLAGTIDAVAGGGGLVSIPMLLSIGMPPHLAFGTNKLQSTIGTFVATRRYYRHGLISPKSIYLGIIFGFFGAVCGAVTTQILDSEILKKIIPILLCIILLYTLFSPKLGHQDEKPRLSEFWFYLIFGFIFGFYDGFFGPGVGSFWVFSLTFFLGYNLIKATAYTKVFNLNSNVVALVCFALGGNIDYRTALCMAAGSLIGGRVGAGLALRKGAKLIRPVFLAVVTVTIATLVYRSYSHSEIFKQLTHQYQTLLIFIGVSILMTIVVLYFKKRPDTN